MASRFYGVNKLRRILKRLPDEAAEPIKTEIRRAGQTLLFEMGARVPRHTGLLARSLRYLITARGFLLRAGVIGAKARRLAFYARWVEFGTKPHSLKRVARVARQGRRAVLQSSGPQHPGTRPQPFVLPAYRAQKAEIVARIGAAIRQALQKVARG